MSQFRLPDQPPVTWARISSSGEGGTKAAHIDGGGTDVYNYLMHTELFPAPSNVSLQTRLRAKLVGMNVGNPSFEGAAVIHRGFKMYGTEPNFKVDRLVWTSNPQSGGRTMWISGDETEFRDYNFIIPLPDREGLDYVTWELVMRSPGQMFISNVECRHYYGKLYDFDIIGTQFWEFNNPDVVSIEFVAAAAALGDNKSSRRWVKYLKTQEISCRKGQNIISTAMGTINGEALGSGTTGGLVVIPSTIGFTLKLRRKGTTTEDWFDVADRYFVEQNAQIYNDSRQVRARYDYDRAQLILYVHPHTPWDKDTTKVRYAAYRDPECDLMIADFVAPSQ